MLIYVKNIIFILIAFMFHSACSIYEKIDKQLYNSADGTRNYVIGTIQHKSNSETSLKDATRL